MESPLRFDIPSLGFIMLTITNVLTFTDGTILGKFFRWMPLSCNIFCLDSFVSFVIQYYIFIVSICAMVISYRWVKDIRYIFYIGLAVFVMVFLFLKFGLKSVGVS